MSVDRVAGKRAGATWFSSPFTIKRPFGIGLNSITECCGANSQVSGPSPLRGLTGVDGPPNRRPVGLHYMPTPLTRLSDGISVL